jgi:hypothetical protein
MEISKSDVRADVLNAEAKMKGAKDDAKPEDRKAHAHKRREIYIGIVAVIIIAGVALALISTPSPVVADISMDGVQVNVTTLSQLKNIAMNETLANEVGIGVVSNPPVNSDTSTPLIVNGTPEIIYLGANYCPFCAVTRWGLILALMRFGNFSVLRYMTSGTAVGEVYPGSPTFTFYNSNYSSTMIKFVPVEEETNNYTQLQTPTVFEDRLVNITDYNNPNVQALYKGGIPFIDFGNISIQAAAPVSPAAIYRNTWNRVIANLSNVGTAQSQAIIGTADVFTARICKMTGGQPIDVCSAAYVRKLS